MSHFWLAAVRKLRFPTGYGGPKAPDGVAQSEINTTFTMSALRAARSEMSR
jgi:hypothetical protein